jgi:DNA-binding beta-propeller fold protein YncE
MSERPAGPCLRAKPGARTQRRSTHDSGKDAKSMCGSLCWRGRGMVLLREETSICALAMRRLVATILVIGCCLGALPAQAQRVVGLGSGFSFPSGVAVGSSGNVFVADSINNTVQVILAAGGYVTVDTLGSGFSGPKGVAVDASGNVFVADTGNNAVEEILAAGG